ncbi:MAG TPA: hypothetical protein VJJ20_03455 [Candidatus Paceibacterota bacterium]
MKKVELSSLQGEQVDTAGEYYMHLRASTDLTNLAVEHRVIDDATLDTFIHDFRQARNAWEVLQVQRPLTRLLYREAIDYSDILLKHSIIDSVNHRELKANLAKGKEFTTRDLEDADHLYSVAARAARGLEDPASASNQIFDGLRNMEQRKKLHPRK